MYTTTTVYNAPVSNPTAHVCVGKNRLKQYGSNVYLNNKQEFEIELFNPKNISVLAKIKLNGSYISTKGVYLKPGERVFLNRFLDKAQKFAFSTYEVDGGNNEVLNAIANNGDVTVEFYDEVIVKPLYRHLNNPNPIVTLDNSFNYLDTYGGNYYSNSMMNTSPEIMCKSDTSSRGVLRSQSLNTNSLPTTPTLDYLSMETGRVEAGSTSNQKFDTVSGNFYSYTSSVVVWKILPQSQEPVIASEIVSNFCDSCGAKIKNDKSNFCHICGNKLK